MKQGIVLALIAILAIGMSIVVVIEHKNPPIQNSLETLFTVIGKPVKTLDRGFTKVLGVNVEDERALGDILAKEFESYAILNHPAHAYLNALIQNMGEQYNPKNLRYRVYVVSGAPNAFALPGGVIGVTTGLLDMLETEAQLVGILGHEKGHIDLSHCIDSMRMEAKNRTTAQGNFIDYYLRMLWQLNFSKTQEVESDQYGFETLISLNYAPEGMAEAFEKLMQSYAYEVQGVLNDYFKTHPSTSIREENWREVAKRWRARHPSSRMYIGQKNYENRISKSQEAYADEWR